MKRKNRITIILLALVLLLTAIAAPATIFAFEQVQPTESKQEAAIREKTDAVDPGFTGLRQEADGNYYLYIKGEWQKSATYIYKKTYYIKEGIWQKNFSGFYKSARDGKSYLIKDGIFQKDATYIYKKTYYVKDGTWRNKFTGFYKSEKDGKSYLIKNGIFQKNATRLYLYQGKYYYVKDGTWRYKYNGLYDSAYSDNVYLIENGIWNSKATYLVPKDGKYYYVKDGKWQKDFTGMYHSIYSGCYHYAQNGIIEYTDGDISKLGSNTGVLVSIEKQYLWLYKNGALILSTPIVSGTLGSTDTPRGTFNILNKVRNTRLIGPTWNVFVNYWMPIDNNGYGIHDATWRDSFGGDIYKYDGSHGCVNMPLEAVTVLAANVSVWTLVKIY